MLIRGEIIEQVPGKLVYMSFVYYEPPYLQTV